MTPQLAIDITARDKTGEGMKKAEERMGKAGRSASKAADGGFSKLNNIAKDLAGLSKIEFGAEGMSRAAEMAKRASESVISFGRKSEEAGGEAKTAGEVAGKGMMALVEGSVAAAAAVVGVGVAVYDLGEKWSKTAASVGRNAKTLGVTTDFLQAARAANERFGVSTEQTDSALDSFTSTLYDARWGGNMVALGAMRQLGIQMKIGKDNAIDAADAYNQVADAIARQKDPMVQKKLAGIFGLSAALPAIRQGSAALTAEGQDYLGSGAALTPEDTEKGDQAERKAVRFKQYLGGIEKAAGVPAMSATAAIADAGVATMHGIAKAPEAIAAGAGKLVDAGVRAADALALGARGASHELLDGGRAAGRAIGDEFIRFTDRIEHQESRGRQFDRYGNPLTSKAGAIGDMQLLPETAKAEAHRAGIAWDPERFRNDKAYNRQIGDAYMARLLRKYDGDEVLASAAYNAGEGRLDGTKKNGYRDGWLARFGDPRKGQISDEDFAARIPYAETRDYVAKTAQAHVTVEFRNAPPGTTVVAKADPGVALDATVHRALDGTP